MSKSRREKVMEEIRNKLELIEKILIDTPEEMGSDEYERLIEETDKAAQALKFLENI